MSANDPKRTYAWIGCCYAKCFDGFRCIPADQKTGNVARVASLSEEELLIQIIGREPHATTGLDCRIGFKDKAIRERSDLPHHFSLPNI
jgi:hypothetical protein